MKTRRFQWAYEGAPAEQSFDVIGAGISAVLLPALSSISSRTEMHPLAESLADAFSCHIPDWPGFGSESRYPGAPTLTPVLLRCFLQAFVERELGSPAVAIAAGHSAAYVIALAAEQPERFSHIVLVAPTWRGPLPTAMGNHRRSLYGRVRRLVETPIVGPALFRLNMSTPVIRKMMHAHVYAEPLFVSPERLAAKMAVTRRRGARFATAAFVTGGLDLVQEREDFLKLFGEPNLPPVLALTGASTPRKSRVDMDALAGHTGICSEVIPGALAADEEYPQAVADAVRRFVRKPN
jgi:pimeloyl-ACP methyl ester carboxylesterase